ncbi:hypothetical protein [Methylocella sp. CPCC 101449]|uniref:hypothetical protein n=1 Tax=Methylocella sp. CPCC 101449 TaxID=2987531 RepID=UPI0028917E30|nr:hypothetical protein [Methylocella sp. CPCC 101449]MDT2022310.1 hypothetical protein [Methylocella sp. CPCC 101449]
MSRWAKLCFFLTAAFYLVALSLSVLLPIMVQIPVLRETVKMLGSLFFYVQIFAFISPTIFWNLAFVIVAVDVLTGRSAKRLMILPVLWFGGYAAAVLLSEREADRFNHALTAQRENNRVAFDPATQDVLVEANEPGPGRRAGGQLSARYTMVQTLGLTTAYELTKQAPEEIKKIELQPTKCSGSGSMPVDPGFREGRRFSSAHNMCITETLERPLKPVLRIVGGKRDDREGLTTVTTRDFQIVMPNGEIKKIRTGGAYPLSWRPQLAFNCRFGAIHCPIHFEFRTRPEVFNPNNVPNVIGHALGLENISLRDRYPQGQWQ